MTTWILLAVPGQSKAGKNRCHKDISTINDNIRISKDYAVVAALKSANRKVND